MANNTILTNVDMQKVDEIMQTNLENSNKFSEIVAKTVKSYSQDLDDLMTSIWKDISRVDTPEIQKLEMYYAKLTNAIYFMSDRIETLSVHNDMAKSAAKEVYNKSYLAYQQKSADGKNKTTVAETTAVAENESQYEQVVGVVYEHAYKQLKFKIDAAQEMVSTLKNLLKSRNQERYLSATSANERNIFDDKEND